MDDKNESEKLMEELKRIGEGFNKFIESIGEALNKLFYPKEDEWEMKCPYEYGDKHYCLHSSGDVFSDCWHGIEADDEYFSQGNIFPTKEAAELESKRRNLLTRFRAFRDECNGDWKADWEKDDEKFYLYHLSVVDMIMFDSCCSCESFFLFGYFKNEKDAERAIELFGDEIKELFVEEDSK